MTTPFSIRSAAYACLLLVGLLTGCDRKPQSDALPAEALPHSNASFTLIPQPAAMQVGEGTFQARDGIPLTASDDAAGKVAEQFSGLVAKTLHWTLKPTVKEVESPGGIHFVIDGSLRNLAREAYFLDVTPQGIRITAKDASGLFYGAVALWQLLGTTPGSIVDIPALRIDDAPRFAWRGLMLDSARHFQSVDEIKQLIDAMAVHKLNTLHWHLTDDQGWRIEIRQYPELTRVGGCRIPAGDTGVDPTTGQPRPYCGFYTQEQIRDVVAYAAQHYITVVPEIDIPGHAQAAVAAYPELGSVQGKTVVSNEWGVNPYLFNPDEKTIKFLENVLDEVITLFPSTYIHVGGDEAVKDQWKGSPAAQQRMQELGLHNEDEMQAYIIKRLEKFLAARKRRLIGWDEILDGGLPAEATVMSWRGTEGGLKAASEGHNVVMSPSSELYFDYLQTDSPDEPPGRPATIPLRRVYEFEPVPRQLAVDKRQHIIGVQGNAWTEHLRTYDRLQHALFPRMAALAETAWTPARMRDYDNFLKRLPEQLRRYQALGIRFATTPFEVGKSVSEQDDGKVQVALSNPLGYPDIRYTTDGSAPTASSSAYTNPLLLALPTRLQAAVFFDGQPLVTPSHWKLDRESLRVRGNSALKMCTDSLMLRLEDDGPADGARTLFNVDIFNPCWEWTNADLGGIAAIQVRAGRIPYYFQLAHDESHRTFHQARSAHGELEIRDRCDGPLLTSLPLPAEPGADGFITLEAPLQAQSDRKDLCIFFTGDTRPAMWVLDEVRLLPESQ